MELFFVVVVAIIWAVIQAASQSQKNTTSWRQSPRTLSQAIEELQEEAGEQMPVFPATAPAQPTSQAPHATAPPIEEENVPDWLTADALVQGVIMAELLGPPRARRRNRI